MAVRSGHGAVHTETTHGEHYRILDRLTLFSWCDAVFSDGVWRTGGVSKVEIEENNAL